MTQPSKLNLKIYQGSTFTQVLRWESATKVYVPITNISKSAPLVITAPNHGVPLGWRARVVNAGGMKELNLLDYMLVTSVTQDTVTFNQVNSLGFTAYTSGGVLEYNQPVPISGYTGRMQIREKVTSTTVLLELTTANGGVTFDSALKTITITIPASTTETLTFKSGVYSLELVSGALVVPFLTGSVTLETEVTR